MQRAAWSTRGPESPRTRGVERAFPLRVIATDKTGKQEFRAEATKIEQKHLDDALFKVPNDYHVVPLTKSMKVASIP